MASMPSEAAIQQAIGYLVGSTNSRNNGVVVIANHPAIRLGIGELPKAEG
jgi:hypothetical protein